MEINLSIWSQAKMTSSPRLSEILKIFFSTIFLFIERKLGKNSSFSLLYKKILLASLSLSPNLSFIWAEEASNSSLFVASRQPWILEFCMIAHFNPTRLATATVYSVSRKSLSKNMFAYQVFQISLTYIELR